MTVVVFGSINLDFVARMAKLPIPGETTIGRDFEMVPGGKGANQAVAVARLGVPTVLVGRVGGDRFGQELLQGLHAAGVQCDGVVVDPETHSGVAMIAVDAASENQIIVIPGANGRVDATEIDRLNALLPTADLLLLQLEVPLPMVLAAAQAAKQAGVLVMLDPAPAPKHLPASLYPLVDILTPNQVEASQLVGFPVTDWATAAQAAEVLRQRGVGTAIVKLGRAGALVVSAAARFEIPSFPVTAVDTVAAGDAFNGGLAAGLAAGLDLQTAARQAAAVAALSVTKSGAQPSLPTRAELETFWALP